MTVIPDKHTFTIWQGATFFEVLTLYETLDKTSPRDFCRQNNSGDIISGAVVTTSNATLPQVTLTFGGATPLLTNTTYSISTATTIPVANNISFTTSSSVSYPYTATLSSITGITEGSSVAATITKRTLNYSAEMIIRNKPQGTALHSLRTTNHPSYNPATDSIIELPVDPATKGQIKLNINKDITATFGTSSSWKTGVYDLTITNISNQVTDALLYGGIKVNGV